MRQRKQTKDTAFDDIREFTLERLETDYEIAEDVRGELTHARYGCRGRSDVDLGYN